ncbi:acyl-CoA dehydrogenase family protein [Tomitella biformata]|uniref:acyl-CoA dehydrogenase family protein n=1 Tax=Tomitella biformata TaxID=630403 RepID=UPI00046348E6|nr:acyl-CoA dehydrogenase family protein [Tomitella biformata]
MDFTRDEGQLAVAEVAAAVLQTAEGTEVPAGSDFDSVLWQRMAAEGILGLALPSSIGGDDLGIAEIGVLLGEAGKVAAQVPVLETLGFGVLPLLALGADAKWLDGVAAGAILTAALDEPGTAMPADPLTTAAADGDGFVVTGRKVAVRFGAQAKLILVPTSAGVAVVAPDADGVELTRTHTGSGAPEYTMVLSGARIAADAMLTGASLPDVYRIALASIAAYAAGLATGVTALTAAHVGTREQFGKPLATFQAVAQQIADVYVTARTLELAATSACWRLSTGRDAEEDVAVAAYWLAEELPAAMQICHHLHGGLGADVTYPMHRYYEHAKDLARLVGGPSARLEILGALGARDYGVEATCSSI